MDQEKNDWSITVTTCMSGSPVDFKDVSDEDLKKICEQEARSFHEHLRNTNDANYLQGLVPWEHSVIVGYLYQKVKNRF